MEFMCNLLNIKLTEIFKGKFCENYKKFIHVVPNFRKISLSQQYKYLGSIINESNSIEEEIKERITLGIKANYVNQKFFKSRLVPNIKN